MVEHLRHHVFHFLRDWLRDEPFDWRPVLAVIIGGVVLLPLTTRLPFLGHDWIVYFDVLDTVPNRAAYPPWTELALTPLTQHTALFGVAFLNSLLLMTVVVTAARQAAHAGRGSMMQAAFLAVVTAPVFMLMWQGNVAGLVLLGIAGMPFMMPYVLMQPNLAVWALVARRSWMLWAAAFMGLTFIVWGAWPFDLLGTIAAGEQRISHPAAMGWDNLGVGVIVIGLALLPFTHADPYRLLSVGAFLTPYVMPQHLVLLLPALGRVGGWRRLALWGISWLTILPVAHPTLIMKYLAMLFPLIVWWMLRPQVEQRAVLDRDAIKREIAASRLARLVFSAKSLR